MINYVRNPNEEEANMPNETKTEEEKGQEAADKVLVDEIADIDFTGDDEPLKDPTDDSSTVDGKGDKDDKTVDDDKESKGGSRDEKTKEEDIKTSEEEKGKEDPTDDKGTKPEESKEKKGEEEGKVDISQVDKLLAEIDRLSGLVEPKVEIPPKKKEEEEEKPKEEEPKKDTEVDLTSYDFLKDLDMDDVASDPKILNKVLHEVIAKVQLRTTEQVLRSIPQVVMSQVNQQTYFKRMADKFYEDNTDLVNVRQVVKACTQQVQQANPEWEIEKVLKEAAVKTRETLGLSTPKIGTTTGDKIPSAKDAAFAKSKGGSKSNLKQQRTSLQTEIDEL